MKLRNLVFVFLIFAFFGNCLAQSKKWTEQQAQEWYKKQPYFVGANFNPATASNQLEMWQADTFDARRIDLELGWAENTGMNVMRVYLHDLLWKQDAKGFTRRIEEYLKIADRHGIKTIFVLFDSCWDPFPVLGRQSPPVAGVHNSRWVQSPGAIDLQNENEYPRLKAYTQGIIGAFKNDKRILAWDVWNEPENINIGSYYASEPLNKVELVNKLLPQVFRWAREENPSQPLTSGVWRGDFSSKEKAGETQKIQLDESDIITFHFYESGVEFEKRILRLQQYNRPIMCTEYMARTNNSTFENTLPVAKKYNVGAINWGLVAGKSQTYLPWDSWQKPYTDRRPKVWFHEVFRGDGKPYLQEEVELIKQITGKK